MTRPTDALKLLQRDHQHVRSLLRKLQKSDEPQEQQDLCNEVVQELRMHTEIEQQVFYPYLRDATARDDLFEEAAIEHRVAQDLLEQLPREEPGTPRFKAVVRVLSDYVEHHQDGLSRSTQHAKWIHTPEDQPERDGQTLATRKMEVIRRWAEARGGRPATTPGGDPERPRVLRVDFPDYDKGLQPVSWEAWGATFQDRNLAFLFQEKLSSGKQSNFFRLDNPEREDA